LPAAPSFVHSSAEVEPGAVVGAGTTIWHHSQVRAGSVVGESCVLGKNVFVDAGAVIGDRVKIQNNVSVYRGVQLADDVFVGPSAVFTNDLRPRTGLRDWQVVVTSVRLGASIGANATIICGIEVGEYGMVGAGAVVTASVLPHQLVVGNPARHHGWVCSCGRVVSRAAQAPTDYTCARCEPQRRPAGPGVAAQHRIRLGRPQFGAEEEAAVIEVLRSGQLISGARVAELEQAFAAEHGAAHAIAVSNGTVALVAALRAHRIGAGDEVVTSPLTFVATLNAILEVGATVRLADVADDFTMDPASLAARITPLTKAVIPVHLYGLPADLAAIGEIAADRDLAVIADAAQAHGARLDGQPVGASGTATFSLYATKNITCGEGGVVTTNDDDVAERLRLLRNHGSADGYDYLMPGYNYRMTELQAAIATVQLRRLAALNAGRADHAAQLAAGLHGLPGLVLPASPPGRLHVWHQYTVRLTAQAPLGRDDLAKELDLAGVDSRAYYPRLAHDYPCYRGHRGVAPDQTPRAAELVRQVLSLPVHPGLSEADVDRVIRAVRQALTSP
jgi:dTDP-4-amino-4,6-dideoxygalactose transaminase/serine acetyltransferase